MRTPPPPQKSDEIRIACPPPPFFGRAGRNSVHPLLQLCRRIRCAVLTEGDVVAEHDFAIGVNDGIVLPIRLILVDQVKIISEEVDDRNHVIGDGDAER